MSDGGDDKFKSRRPENYFTKNVDKTSETSLVVTDERRNAGQLR